MRALVFVSEVESEILKPQNAAKTIWLSENISNFVIVKSCICWLSLCKFVVFECANDEMSTYVCRTMHHPECVARCQMQADNILKETLQRCMLNSKFLKCL